MTTPQFKSMNDLMEYLSTLEERITKLEAENKNLSVAQSKNIIDGSLVSKMISRHLPKSELFSPGFLKRAFAVWGHFMTANFIISIILGSIYFCLMMAAFGSLFSGISQGP